MRHQARHQVGNLSISALWQSRHERMVIMIETKIDRLLENQKKKKRVRRRREETTTQRGTTGYARSMSFLPSLRNNVFLLPEEVL